MKFTYDYGVFAQGEAPTIPVMLLGSGKFIRVMGLVDSGSDEVVISRSLADLLGLGVDKVPMWIEGVGGCIKAWKTNACLVIDQEIQVMMDIPILAAEGIEEYGIILGRKPFFESFIISFDESNKKVFLES